jgi:hypothetical protein
MDKVASLVVSCFFKSWVRRVNGLYIYIYTHTVQMLQMARAENYLMTSLY